MDEREQKLRQIISWNNKLIHELKLQNQTLAGLLPRPREKKPFVFPPRPGAKKKGGTNVEKA